MKKLQNCVIISALLFSFSNYFLESKTSQEEHSETLQTIIEEIKHTHKPAIGCYDDLITKLKLLIKTETNPEYKKQFLFLFSLLKACNISFTPDVTILLEKENPQNILFSPLFIPMYIVCRLGWEAFKGIWILSIFQYFLQTLSMPKDDQFYLLCVSALLKVIPIPMQLWGECQEKINHNELLKYYLKQPEFKLLQELYQRN